MSSEPIAKLSREVYSVNVNPKKEGYYSVFSDGWGMSSKKGWRHAFWDGKQWRYRKGDVLCFNKLLFWTEGLPDPSSFS